MDYNNYSDNELLDDFGLTIGVNKSGKIEGGDINIYAGDIHPESLKVGMVLNKYCEEFSNIFSERVGVILSNYKVGTYYKIIGNEMIPVEGCRFIYSTRNHMKNTIFDPDLKGFSELVSNKHLTNKILNQKGFNTPKEVLLNSDMGVLLLKKIYSIFIDNIHDSSCIVIKPCCGERGEGVNIESKNISFTDFFKNYIKNQGDVLLQEKIESYPIYINNNRKDWNLRVLISYDNVTKGYKCNGMVGRVGDYNKVINISKGSEFISIDELIQYLPPEFNQKEIIRSCEQIVSVLTLSLNNQDNEIDVQDLSGVDIILNQNMETIVLEVNDSLSGGLYHLTKYHGESSIDYYILNILRKIKLYLDYNSK